MKTNAKFKMIASIAAIILIIVGIFVPTNIGMPMEIIGTIREKYNSKIIRINCSILRSIKLGNPSSNIPIWRISKYRIWKNVII